MVALFIITGVVAGALVGYLIGDRRGRGESARVRTELAVANQRQSDAAGQLSSEKELNQNLREQLSQSEVGRAGVGGAG